MTNAITSKLAKLVTYHAQDVINEMGSGMPWADFMDETTYYVCDAWLETHGVELPERYHEYLEEMVAAAGQRLLANPSDPYRCSL